MIFAAEGEEDRSEVLFDNELLSGEHCLNLFGIMIRENNGNFRSCLDVMSDLVKVFVELREHEDKKEYQVKKSFILNGLLGPRYRYELWDIDEPIGFIDSVGGCHEDGCGWAPDGSFCGECSNITCKDCQVWRKMQ